MIRLLELFLASLGAAFALLFRSENPGAKFGLWLFSKKVLIILISAGFIFTLGYFWIAFQGPHMHMQPHILPFQTVLPLPNDSAVTVEDNSLWPIRISYTNQSDSTLIMHGKIYYKYYCYFCHGDIGSTIGPVGHSFVPTPDNLLSIKGKNLSDSAIVSIIVNGQSHNPLLPYVIAPENRLAIAKYVKDAVK